METQSNEIEGFVQNTINGNEIGNNLKIVNE